MSPDRAAHLEQVGLQVAVGLPLLYAAYSLARRVKGDAASQILLAELDASQWTKDELTALVVADMEQRADVTGRYLQLRAVVDELLSRFDDGCNASALMEPLRRSLAKIDAQAT